MIFQRIIILLIIGFGIIGCAPMGVQQSPYNQGVYAPDVSESIKDKSSVVVDELNFLYKKDYTKWRNKIKQMLYSNKNQLSKSHLVHAVKAFNNIGDRQLCLESTFLYLNKQVNDLGVLERDDRELFIKFVEYVLRHPDTFEIARIQVICNSIQDDICNGIR